MGLVHVCTLNSVACIYVLLDTPAILPVSRMSPTISRNHKQSHIYVTTLENPCCVVDAPPLGDQYCCCDSIQKRRITIWLVLRIRKDCNVNVCISIPMLVVIFVHKKRGFLIIMWWVVTLRFLFVDISVGLYAPFEICAFFTADVMDCLWQTV
jgi:hypothetical protein